MNYLKAIFWDYPSLTDSENLKKFIQEHSNSERIYMWLLKRFLEYGRVVDTLEYFPIKIISEQIPGIKLTPYSLKKWKRMIEVYGKTPGK